MKIKKVEIQAFRAYDKVENGTFDFQRSEDGEYADFISLYAPNGFGKTSFYDAVEYGYTKNIDRFLKNIKINQESAKSEKNINQGGTQYILRNKYSDLTLESYVKIQLSNNQDPIVRNIPTITRKGASDFKFDEKETENKYFREVILSQDWISGFLKEDKSDDRYKTFIEYFGDKELDKYYNILSLLITQNEKEIKKLTTKLKGVQLELKFDGDKDILFKINEKIQSLNKKVKLFNTIDSQSSESDILNLTNSISEQLNNIQFEISKHQNLILNLDKLIIGDDQLLSFKQFKENTAKLKKSIGRQKELVLIMTKFEDLEKKKSELISIQENNKKLVNEKEQKEKILSQFSKYKDTVELIKDRDKEVKKLKSSQDALNKEISSQKAEISKLEIQISTTHKEINNIKQTVDKLPEIEQSILNSEDTVKQSNKGLDLKKSELEKRFKNIESLGVFINELSSALIDIEKGIFPSEFDKNFVKYSEQLRKYDVLKKKFEEENKSLNLVKNDIVQQDNFQAELENFISKGLSIINAQKTDNCPLCNQDYESYTALADKVVNNNLLSQKSSLLLNRRNEIENVISSISEQIKKTIDKLIGLIKKDISESELKVKDLNGQVLDIKKSITEFEAKIEEESKTISNFKNLTLNKTSEEYTEWSKKHLIKLIIDIETYISNLAPLQEKLKNNDQQSEIILQRIELFTKEKESLSNEKIFNEVKSFFLENYPNLNIDSSHIDTDITELTNIQEELFAKLDNLKEYIKAIENELASINEDSTKKELEKINDNNRLFSRPIESYKNNAKKYIDLDLEKTEEEAFVYSISNIKKSNEIKISDYQNEEKELNLLFQLKENVLPYLKFEESKQKETDIKARIQFLKTKVGKKLSEEIKKVSEHIEKQIKSFFYEDLINDLYKRIDPHPEYKKVKFIPDFKDNKPKLNVCVYKDNEDTKFIIPNLYFSQAQLNILSLCIFLAKALNAKDADKNPIDCIFIDDPIQSMDSINILSTIDLLRSIVVNQQKQIILSTHDENFHNLLKKKIPTNLFKSKFMELETFGKVKVNQ